MQCIYIAKCIILHIAVFDNCFGACESVLLSHVHTRHACRRTCEESDPDSVSKDGSFDEGSLERWEANVREVNPTDNARGSSGHSRKRVSVWDQEERKQ